MNIARQQHRIGNKYLRAIRPQKGKFGAKRPAHKSVAKRGKHKHMTTALIRNPRVLPDRTFVKLRYMDNTRNSFTFNGGNLAIETYRGNGSFDPDMRTGNYGCYGYKQWSAFYNKYRVHSSTIRVRFINDATTAANVYKVACWPSDLPGTGSSAQFGPAHPYSKSQFMTAQGDNSTVVIKNYMSTVKMEGDKGAQYDTTFASNVQDIPTNQWYWNISAQKVTSGPLTGAHVLLDVQITYYVEFYSRKDLSATLNYFQAGEDPVNPPEPENVGQTGPTGDPSGFIGSIDLP